MLLIVGILGCTGSMEAFGPITPGTFIFIIILIYTNKDKTTGYLISQKNAKGNHSIGTPVYGGYCYPGTGNPAQRV
jgi:hypothetical protein